MRKQMTFAVHFFLLPIKLVNNSFELKFKWVYQLSLLPTAPSQHYTQHLMQYLFKKNKNKPKEIHRLQ